MTKYELGKTIKDYLLKNKGQKVLVEIMYMALMLLFWANYVLPTLKITDVEPKIGLIIAGFTMSSLILILTVLPIWLRQFTYWIVRLVRSV